MKKRSPFEPEEQERFVERFSSEIEDCRGDSNQILNAIKCLIKKSQNEVRDLRNECEQMKLDALSSSIRSQESIRYLQNCNSPADFEFLIEEESQYIEFLKMKRDDLPKEIQVLKDNEKFEILFILGLFNTNEWNKIKNRQDQNRLLSQLLEINIDTAKNLINEIQKNGNSKYRLKVTDREILGDRIKSMQNGVKE